MLYGLRSAVFNFILTTRRFIFDNDIVELKIKVCSITMSKPPSKLRIYIQNNCSLRTSVMKGLNSKKIEGTVSKYVYSELRT